MYTERDHIRRFPISPHPYKFLAGTNERLLLYPIELLPHGEEGRTRTYNPRLGN